MKCQPGDLAIVVNDCSMPINNGRLVRVVRKADPREYFNPNVDWDCAAVSPIWVIRGHLAEPGNEGFGYRDSELMPIRDPGDDAQDETLGWLPVPLPQLETV